MSNRSHGLCRFLFLLFLSSGLTAPATGIIILPELFRLLVHIGIGIPSQISFCHKDVLHSLAQLLSGLCTFLCSSGLRNRSSFRIRSSSGQISRPLFRRILIQRLQHHGFIAKTIRFLKKTFFRNKGLILRYKIYIRIRRHRLLCSFTVSCTLPGQLCTAVTAERTVCLFSTVRTIHVLFSFLSYPAFSPAEWLL